MVGLMRKRIVWWGAAVAVVIAASTATIAMASSRDGQVLSQDDVNRELSSPAPSVSTDAPTPEVSASDDPSASPSPGDAGLGAAPGLGQEFVLPARPATLVVTCSSRGAELIRWTLNPGYRADDVARGPAATVSAYFESDQDDDVRVTIRCVDGRAVVDQDIEPDDHGGDRHGGGGGSGRG